MRMMRILKHTYIFLVAENKKHIFFDQKQTDVF